LYLSSLEKSREPWQVKQAEQALRRFDYFLSRTTPTLIPVMADHGAWTSALNQTRDVLRVKQLALNTEKTYLDWFGTLTDSTYGPQKNPKRIPKP
jgi:hypothetical protein